MTNAITAPASLVQMPRASQRWCRDGRCDPGPSFAPDDCWMSERYGSAWESTCFEMLAPPLRSTAVRCHRQLAFSWGEQ